MKKFESFLAGYLEDFIKYRGDLGYVNTSLRTNLRNLDRYVLDNAQEWEHLIPDFFLRFRDQLHQAPAAINAIILSTRNFFDYMHRNGLCPCNPIQDLPGKTENSFIPFIFSEEQVQQLLQEAGNLVCRDKPKNYLVDMGIYTAIVLLAGCGLRISEPLRLMQDQYDPIEGTIFIQKTKFHKDRFIPLPQKSKEILDNYLNLRNTFVDFDNPYLLVGFRKNIRSNQIYQLFYKAVQITGIHAPRKCIGSTVFGTPTPHSLRHSFAVNTLKAARERGQDPQAVLPVLSAYMGHSKYRYTALYLKVMDAEKRQGFVDFAISRLEDI